MIQEFLDPQDHRERMASKATRARKDLKVKTFFFFQFHPYVVDSAVVQHLVCVWMRERGDVLYLSLSSSVAIFFFGYILGVLFNNNRELNNDIFYRIYYG